MYCRTLFSTLFFIVFTLIFLFEGTGVLQGTWVAYHLILSLPLLLSISCLVDQDDTPKKISIPTVHALLFGGFIISSVISTVVSRDIQRSFEQTVLLLALFLLYLIMYGNKKNVIQLFVFLTMLIPFLFIGIGLYLTQFENQLFVNAVFSAGFQYVRPLFRTSHPLGAVLILPLALMIPYVFHSKKFRAVWILGFGLGFLLLLFTFMRSAIAAIIVSVCAYIVFSPSLVHRHIGKITLSVCIVFSIFLGLFSLNASVRNIFQNTNPFDILVENKGIFDARTQYARQAVLGIIERPWWGNGPDTFEVVSRRYAGSPSTVDISSHNLVLDLLSDHGVFGLLFFIFVLYTIITSRADLSGNSRLFTRGLILVSISILVLYQLFRFQRYPAHLLYFILLLGLITKSKKHVYVPISTFILVSGVVFILSQSMIVSSIALKQGLSEFASAVYPLNKQAYMTSIRNGVILQPEESSMMLRLSRQDYYFQRGIAQHYEDKGDSNRALKYFLSSHELYPIGPFNHIAETYNLIIQVKGTHAAHDFFSQYLKRHMRETERYPHYNYEDHIRQFCIDQGIDCPGYVDK